MNKFLCRILGHVFRNSNLDITKDNICHRCGHNIKLVPEGVRVPNYGGE